MKIVSSQNGTSVRITLTTYRQRASPTGSAPTGGGPYDLPAKVSVVRCTDVVTGFQEHHYLQIAQPVVADIRAVLCGERSEEIENRLYVPETKSYRLRD